jgi:hypothetical protein
MTRTFLTEKELKELVPAAYSHHADPNVSDKYVFIPTYKVIEYLGNLGWKPVYARQNYSKKERKYAKHIIRFSNKEGLLEKGEVVNEFVYIGAHDRSFVAELNAGLRRCICGNQMTISAGDFACMFTKHIGFIYEEFEKKMKETIKQFTILSKKVETYKTIQLTEVEKNKFAYVASMAHWKGEVKIDSKLLLNVRRPEDESDNLWTVFNRIQENIIKGGVTFNAKSDKTGKPRTRTTRGVKNIIRDHNINKELWNIMAAFATTRKF